MSPNLLIAGATGLVGREILARACAADRVAAVTVVSRRPLDRYVPRARVRVEDFSTIDTADVEPCTHAVCALGTTIARAGSQSAFRAVDLDAVLHFARFARRGGATRFGVVSSVGADAHSRNFYLRVKGEAEEALREVGFDGLYLLRPGLLLGDREEWRPTEAVMRTIGPALNTLLHGRLRQYRSVHATDVAAGLLGAVLDGPPGIHVMHWDQIMAAGRRGGSSPESQ